MRILAGVAVAALFASGMAWAQPSGQPAAQPAVEVPASSCGAFPSTPPLPDGATATPEAMQSAQTALQTFDTSYRAILNCRRGEVDRLNAELQHRRDEYNAGATALNTLVANWQAEIDEFNARQPRRRGRN